METNMSIEETLQKILEQLQQLNTKPDIKPKNAISLVWYDIQETCLALKVSKRTLQLYRQKGFIPYSKIDGKIYYRITDIEMFLQSHITGTNIERSKVTQTEV